MGKTAYAGSQERTTRTPVTATAIDTGFNYRGVTVADRFTSSISGFADWLPYAGRHKNPRTIKQYVTAAQRLAAWAREHGRQDFAELSKADLRAFLNSLPGRGGKPASASSKATIWWAIRSLFQYLEDEEDVPDIARSITIGPPQTDRISHLDPHEVTALLKACQDPRERQSSGSPWTAACESPSWPP